MDFREELNRFQSPSYAHQHQQNKMRANFKKLNHEGKTSMAQMAVLSNEIRTALDEKGISVEEAIAYLHDLPPIFTKYEIPFYKWSTIYAGVMQALLQKFNQQDFYRFSKQGKEAIEKILVTNAPPEDKQKLENILLHQKRVKLERLINAN